MKQIKFLLAGSFVFSAAKARLHDPDPDFNQKTTVANSSLLYGFLSKQNANWGAAGKIFSETNNS